MSRKSKNPRKDIPPVLSYPLQDVPFSEKDFSDLEQQSGASFSVEQRQELLFILQRYIGMGERLQTLPDLKRVREKLEEYRYHAKALWGLLIGANGSGAMETDGKNVPALQGAYDRLWLMGHTEGRKHLWDTGGKVLFHDRAISTLSSFFVGCEKAIQDIDAEIEGDSGGRCKDRSRESLLLALDSFFTAAKGKRGSRERFIVAVVSKIPQKHRPCLPEGADEILKIIRAAKNRNRAKLPPLLGG